MISIITAFYNAADRINKLKKALSEQTNNDFEWIIIDDCSREADYNFLLELSKKTDIKIIVDRNEKNEGPGVARTNGLKRSSGDYITFVDSDDLITDDFIETISNVAKEKKVDIIAFDYAIFKGNKKFACSKIDNNFGGIVKIDNFILNAKTCICGSAFSRDLIINNNIVFPALYRYEDWVFNIRAATKSSTIWYCKKELYYYIEESTSLVKSGKYDAGDYAIQAFKILEPLLDNISEDIKKLLYAREIIYVNAVSNAKYLKGKEYNEKLNFLQNKCLGWQRNHLLKKISIHQRVILKLISMRMYFVVRIGVKIIV